MEKVRTSYKIMHKNRKVAVINTDGSCKIYAKTFLPYNLYLEEDDSYDVKVNNLTNFYYWCSSRVLTLDRKYAKEILNTIGATQSTSDRDRANIALSYHCLSLTDVYWVNTNNEKIKYEDINLYENHLSNAFIDVSLRGKSLTVQNAELLKDVDVAGDVGTLGVAPKAWIREENDFYLLKDGNSKDVKAELLASKIARCFKVNQVLYEQSEYKGKLVSKSKIITSLDYSLVNAEYVNIYALNRDSHLLDYILKVDAYSYYMMNIIDYLVGNNDRHWGNWGFLMDNETNKPVGLYPLMDFNKAFMAYSNLNGSICMTAEDRISQKDAAIYAVKKVGLNQVKEVNREWFTSKTTYDMFEKRLGILKRAMQ